MSEAEKQRLALEALAQRGEAVRIRLMRYGIPCKTNVTRLGDKISVSFEGSPQLTIALAEMLASDMAKHLGETPEDGMYTFPDTGLPEA